MGFKSHPGDGIFNKGMKGGRTFKNNTIGEVLRRILKAWRAQSPATIPKR
jgi:hypothetical protein